MSKIPSVDEVIEDLMKQNDGVVAGSFIPIEQQLERKRAEYKELLEFTLLKDNISLAIETIKSEFATTLPQEEYESLLSEIASAGEILEVDPAAEDNSLEIATSTFDAIYSLGIAFLEKKNFSVATAIFTLLVTLDPSWFRHWFYLGVSLQEQKLYSDAINAYQMANKITEADPLPHLFTAECYCELSDLQAARSHLEKGREIADREVSNAQWSSLIEELSKKIT